MQTVNIRQLKTNPATALRSAKEDGMKPMPATTSMQAGNGWPRRFELSVACQDFVATHQSGTRFGRTQRHCSRIADARMFAHHRRPRRAGRSEIAPSLRHRHRRRGRSGQASGIDSNRPSGAGTAPAGVSIGHLSRSASRSPSPLIRFNRSFARSRSGFGVFLSFLMNPCRSTIAAPALLRDQTAIGQRYR